ncbi:MAG: hypothetical protein LBT32_07540 [Peptococcaceae bacterium]|nr:hypothetical protein [Peptococcaceae bacterium]
MTMKQKYMKPTVEEIVLSINERLASNNCSTEGAPPLPPGWVIDEGPIS